MKIQIVHDLTIDEVASQLTADMNSRQLFNFIKKLDQYNVDWELIKLLHKWTTKEMKTYEDESLGE